MGLAFPVPFGALSGLTGENLIVTAEKVLRNYYGEGVYNLDDESGHWYYRRGLSQGFALNLAELVAQQANAIADRSEMFIDEWEHAVGINASVYAADPEGYWTLENRWDRILGRFQETDGPALAEIKQACRECIGIAGEVGTFHENLWAGNGSLEVKIYTLYAYKAQQVRRIRDVLYRLVPAHIDLLITTTPGPP